MKDARGADAAAPSLRFTREHRLRSSSDFKRVYAQGRRLGNELFTVNVQPNTLGSARLGMSVAVRSMGSAVRRNRVRRMIRESFRLHRAAIPAVDVIIGVRAIARDASAAAVRDSLDQIWQRLGRHARPAT